MKRVDLLFVLMISTISLGSSQPRQLTRFSDLLQVLRAGNEVRVVIDYEKCSLVIDTVEAKSPAAIGGMSLGTFEYFAPMAIRNPKAFVTSSQTVLISHPRYGYVLNYVKMKIIENDSVEVTARYLNPVNYQIVMDEIFYGAISKGEDGRGIRLFVR